MKELILPFAQYNKENNSLDILHKNVPNGVTNLYTEAHMKYLVDRLESCRETNGRFVDLIQSLREETSRLYAELDKQGEPVAWMSPDGKVSKIKGTLFYIPLYSTPQTKPLSDALMNKAFDYYCETDEGVLRFDYELRKEWKKKNFNAGKMRLLEQ
jgi:hypothetical protein